MLDIKNFTNRNKLEALIDEARTTIASIAIGCDIPIFPTIQHIETASEPDAPSFNYISPGIGIEVAVVLEVIPDYEDRREQIIRGYDVNTARFVKVKLKELFPDDTVRLADYILTKMDIYSFRNRQQEYIPEEAKGIFPTIDSYLEEGEKFIHAYIYNGKFPIVELQSAKKNNTYFSIALRWIKIDFDSFIEAEERLFEICYEEWKQMQP